MQQIQDIPVLYSFRRCPYAMRARLAVQASGVSVALREVVLRDKPRHMIEVSPKATVPVLLLPKGEVLEESLDIMHWALAQSDPLQWLPKNKEMQEMTAALIAENDGPFKKNLDHYKYPNRYDEISGEPYREQAMVFVLKLEECLTKHAFLSGEHFGLADAAILPFMRQFAHVDKNWFDGVPIPKVQKWLKDFLDMQIFRAIMPKFKQWYEGDPPLIFP